MRCYLGIIVLMYSIYENACEPLVMTLFPKNTTLFYYQNATLDCIFNYEVNCVWKKDGVVVTMNNYASYLGLKNGKNTAFCSIELYTASNDHTGIWSCENEVNEAKNMSVIAKAIVSVQECGKANEWDLVEEKIAGGEETTINKYPWIVTIHNKSKSWYYPMYSTLICHGNLISRKWILTAAHCAYTNQTSKIRSPPEEFLVSFGRGQLVTSFMDSRTPWSKVCEIVVHPLFNTIVLDYDIALMKLKLSVEFSKFVSPICLPPAGINYNKPEMEAIVAGFGTTEKNIISAFLLEITIPLVPVVDCWRVWNYRDLFLSDRMICAGQLEGKQRPCQGDSGSGLIIKHSQKFGSHRFVIIGLYSRGYIECPSSTQSYPNRPNIFTKVDDFLPFINSHMLDEVCPAFSL